IRLCDRELAFLDGRQEVDTVGHASCLDSPIRRLEEAVLVGTRVHGQRVDQADVRTFRRFDRTYTTIVSRMHVAHFEARTLARQAAWAESRDAPLVRDLGQRIVLVHEL